MKPILPVRVALFPLALIVGVSLLLGGCSWFKKDEDTAAAKTVKPLEVPPDLVKPNAKSAFLPPAQQAGAVTQAASQAQVQAQLSGRVAPRWQGVTRLHESGQHWLLVNATPEQVWPLVGNFLKERGYGIAQSEPAIGLMESEWKVLTAPGNGASGLREQVRLRVESYREPGRTEVFLNLKLSEAAANGAWNRGAADEERSIELLNRLAQYLGASKIDDSVPEAPVAAAPATPAAEEKPNRFLLGPTTEEEKAEVRDRWKRVEETCAICPPR